MKATAPRIHFKVAKDGNVQLVDVVNGGQSCTDLTAAMERAIGIADEQSREATASAYQEIEPLRLTVNRS